MSKKLMMLMAVMAVVATVIAGFMWRSQDLRVRAERREAAILKGFSGEELEKLLLNQALTERGAVEAIIASIESRRAFLGGLREYLALAAEARREGLGDLERFRINFEYKKKILLADLYRAKLTAAQGKYYVVPPDSLSTVWNSPENEKAFEADMEALRSIQVETAKIRGDESVYGKLQGGSLAKARDNWANTKVLSETAIADAEFIGQPEIGLRLKLLEAGILSSDYLRKHWTASVRATPAEIAKYLSEHPEYAQSGKRAKAEDALKRALAGDDFAALAKEISEDRSTREKGGLYENVSPDDIWPKVAEALAQMKKGQIAGNLIETETGFHVVQLISRTEPSSADNAHPIYAFRHILLQKAFEDPEHVNKEIPAPFVPAETIARNAVEKGKRAEFVNAIVGRSGIALPDDFSVNLPAK